MLFYGAGELDAMLAEFGVTVSIADQWYAPGVVDAIDRSMLTGDAATLAGRMTSVTVKTGALGPQLKEGTTLTIWNAVVDEVTIHSTGSTDYKIYSVFQQDDGALTNIVCLRK